MEAKLYVVAYLSYFPSLARCKVTPCLNMDLLEPQHGSGVASTQTRRNRLSLISASLPKFVGWRLTGHSRLTTVFHSRSETGSSTIQLVSAMAQKVPFDLLHHLVSHPIDNKAGD